MPAQFTPTLYIRLRKRVILPKGQPVRLGQVAQILTEPEWEKHCHELVVYEPNDRDEHLVLIDMMKIIPNVKQLVPNMNIEFLGDPQAIVEFMEPGPRKSNGFILFCVCLLLFVGSGLAIMNFHADVSMIDVHRRLNQLITGTSSEHPYWLQIPYSIGIGAGMMIFFNRLFKKKFNEEPNPLEIEMHMYQESVNQFVVAEEYRKHQEKGSNP